MEQRPIPPIIKMWIDQLTQPDVIQMVETFGDKRRIDLTVFSDRGRVNRPPKHSVI